MIKLKKSVEIHLIEHEKNIWLEIPNI